MRRGLSTIQKFMGAGVLGLLIALPATSASALDYSSEDHCFANSRNRAVLHAEDQYANGSMQDPEKVSAVEELTNRHWQLRLSNLPFTYDGQIFRGSFGNASTREYGFLDALTSIMLERAEERRNRQTGSRYLYVKPQMKLLARERGQIRSLKQKPCNPHILYLG